MHNNKIAMQSMHATYVHFWLVFESDRSLFSNCVDQQHCCVFATGLVPRVSERLLHTEYPGATPWYEGLRILRLPDVKPPCLTCRVFGPGNFFARLVTPHVPGYSPGAIAAMARVAGRAA